VAEEELPLLQQKEEVVEVEVDQDRQGVLLLFLQKL